MTRRRPWIKDQQTAQWLAIGFLALGVAFTYDAWEGRGRETPKILSALFPN